MTHSWKILVITLSLALPGWTLAQDDNPDDAAADVRQALMQLMGWNMGTVATMSTGKAPYDQARAMDHGERLAALGGMIGDAFERDTSGADLSRTTQALDAIWENKDDFTMKATAMVDAAKAYSAAAAESEATARKAFVKLGGTCKGCHEDFKSE